MTRLVTPTAAEARYRVRFDEAGADGQIRRSVLLRYAQDVAWVHSEAMGFDRAWYLERGLAWLVRSAELEVDRPIRAGVEVVARTEVVGFRKVWARRRTEIRDAGATSRAAPLAWLHTDWVMTDLQGGPARVPAEIPRVFGTPEATFSPLRVPLRESSPEAVARELSVRQHEVDPMGHANNAVYLDWAEEVAVAVPGRLVPDGRVRLEYLVPAAPGERLAAVAWKVESADEIAVSIRRSDGTELFRAAIAADAPRS